LAQLVIKGHINEAIFGFKSLSSRPLTIEPYILSIL